MQGVSEEYDISADDPEPANVTLKAGTIATSGAGTLKLILTYDSDGDATVKNALNNLTAKVMISGEELDGSATFGADGTFSNGEFTYSPEGDFFGEQTLIIDIMAGNTKVAEAVSLSKIYVYDGLTTKATVSVTGNSIATVYKISVSVDLDDASDPNKL